MRTAAMFLAGWGLAMGGALHAQTPLTLDEAMARARAQHPSARAAAARERAARHQVAEARGRYLPRVDISEAWQRGSQPVFVFSSLLAQRRFAAENFAIRALNHPEAVNNTRTLVAVEQMVFDGGLTRLAVRGAGLSADLAEAAATSTAQQLAFEAAEAYAGVAQLEADERAAAAAVEAAAQDLDRARNRRDAGLATEADVLSVDVHAAGMRRRLVQTTGDLRVARTRLSAALGAPLDETFALRLPAPPPVAAADLPALERQALETRPEAREAALGLALASTATASSRAAFLPHVAFSGGYELNGEEWGGKVSSWTLGAEVRLNLFRGFADRARLASAREAETAQAAERERLERQIRLDVRSAVARLDAARAREEVGRAALAQALESQRILRDRYDSGLATVTDMLRAAQAVFEAESQAIGARVDVILRQLDLDRAVGRL
jgi:outer membrane protein TolC